MRMLSEITIIYASDANEWDHYLTECFEQVTGDYPTLIITHKRIEDIITSNQMSLNNNRPNAVLLILSPDFLNLIEKHAIVSELWKLLDTKKTVVMLCGIRDEDITAVHTSKLVNYYYWKRLVAKDRDKQFVVNVIQTVLDLMQDKNGINGDENLFKYCTHFELCPNTVSQENKKVFILLERPINENEKIHLSIDGYNEILDVKWKNPYTLYFTVPYFMINFSTTLHISLICGHKYMGTNSLICEQSIIYNNSAERFSHRQSSIPDLNGQNIYSNNKPEKYAKQVKYADNHKKEPSTAEGMIAKIIELNKKYENYDIPRHATYAMAKSIFEKMSGDNNISGSNKFAYKNDEREEIYV